ncbi:MAG TPA: hypothetical protein VFV50_02240, partial [Bdellovibrionales bacterium]|nr:hypothetical protein [Bdellovibrionales bacterium]
NRGILTALILISFTGPAAFSATDASSRTNTRHTLKAAPRFDLLPKPAAGTPAPSVSDDLSSRLSGSFDTKPIGAQSLRIGADGAYYSPKRAAVQPEKKFFKAPDEHTKSTHAKGASK